MPHHAVLIHGGGKLWISALVMATHALGGVGIQKRCDEAPATQMANLSGCSSVAHFCKKLVIMAGETECFSSLRSTHEPVAGTVDLVAGAASKIALPVQRVSGGRLVLGCKTAGVADLDGFGMALSAQDFLAGREYGGILCIDAVARQVATGATAIAQVLAVAGSQCCIKHSRACRHDKQSERCRQFKCEFFHPSF